jgi:hypothetical protein
MLQISISLVTESYHPATLLGNCHHSGVRACLNSFTNLFSFTSSLCVLALAWCCSYIAYWISILKSFDPNVAKSALWLYTLGVQVFNVRVQAILHRHYCRQGGSRQRNCNHPCLVIPVALPAVHQQNQPRFLVSKRWIGVSATYSLLRHHSMHRAPVVGIASCSTMGRLRAQPPFH